MIELKTLLMAYSAVMAPLALLVVSLIILQFKILAGIGSIKEEFGRELAVIKEKLEHTATKEELSAVKEEFKGELQKQSERLTRVEYALTYSRDGASENLPEKEALKVGEKEPQKYKERK